MKQLYIYFNFNFDNILPR